MTSPSQKEPICAGLSPVWPAAAVASDPWNLQAPQEQEAPPFNAQLVYLQLAGTFLIRMERSRTVLVIASYPRKCLQVLDPSMDFFLSGTVPLFHKILCIRPFPSGHFLFSNFYKAVEGKVTESQDLRAQRVSNVKVVSSTSYPLTLPPGCT